MFCISLTGSKKASITTVIVFVFLLLFPLALAQHWEFEQVDTGAVGSKVQIRRAPDGTTFLCYERSRFRLRVAHKDSVWHREDIDTSFMNIDMGRLAFDIGPNGEAGLVCRDDSCRIMYVEHTDTNWIASETPFRLGWYPTIQLSFDSSGAPTVMFTGQRGIEFGVRSGSTWVVETTYTGNGMTGYHDFWVGCLRTNRDNEPGAIIREDVYLQDSFSGRIWWAFLYLLKRTGGTWSTEFLASDNFAGVSPLSLAFAATGQEKTLFAFCPCMGSWYLYCEGTAIDSTGASSGTILIDSLERPHVTYVSGGVKYGYRTGSWHIDTIPGTNGATSCDLLLDEEGQPIIAFDKPGNGVWIAHGIGIVAYEEADEQEPLQEETSLRVVSSPARVPIRMSCSGSFRAEHAVAILDAAGRQIRRLAVEPTMSWDGRDESGREMPAGVYFVSVRDGHTTHTARLVKIE